jgi:hypothetical protein
MERAASMTVRHLISCALVASALTLILLTGPAAAKTTAASLIERQSQLFDAWLGPHDRPQPLAGVLPAGRNYHLVAVAAGSLAGAMVGIAFASLLPTPLGAGVVMAPAIAVAAGNGAIYAARAVTVMVGTGIGGFIASWIYHNR